MILLSKTDVVAMHQRSIAMFGGSPGIRDESALESALVAAENRLWYEQADAVACAAAYAYHLTMAHAFIDGNKRVAAAATEVFLVANGFELQATDTDLYELFMSVASGETNRDGVEFWLRRRLGPGSGA
jgi:death-on-curing protein